MEKLPPNKNLRVSQAKISPLPQKWKILPVGKFMPEDRDELWYIIIRKENGSFSILCGDDYDEEVFEIKSIKSDQNLLNINIFIGSIKKRNTYSLYLRNSTELRCVICKEEKWTAVNNTETRQSIIIDYDNEDRDSLSNIRLEYKRNKFEFAKLSIINKITGARTPRRMGGSTPSCINFSTGTNNQSLKLKTSIDKISPQLDQFVLSQIIDYKMRKIN